MCRDKDGYLLTNKEDILNKCVEHFQGLLGNEQYQTPHDDAAPVRQNREQVQPHTKEEVARAMQKLKNSKSADTDGLPGELFKNSEQALIHNMHKVITKIWEEERMSNE